MFPQVIQPIYKIGEEEAETLCPYSTGAIIRFGCRILSEGLQVLSLGGEPGEGGLKLGAGDYEKGIASSQVKGGNLDVGGRPFVCECQYHPPKVGFCVVSCGDAEQTVGVDNFTRGVDT